MTDQSPAFPVGNSPFSAAPNTATPPLCAWWSCLQQALAEAFLGSRASQLLLVLSHYSQLQADPSLASVVQDLCRALSRYLHEPDRAVKGLLRRHWQFQHLLEFRRNRVLTGSALVAHVRSFAYPQCQAFAALARSQRNSRILVSFHFGDYVYGLNTVLAGEPAGRDVFALSHSPCSSAYLANIRSAFGKSAPGLRAQLLLGEESATSLSARLRRGNCTLVMFCDLAPAFGERTAVQFLGRRAWFSRGAATLALTNRVPLIPVLCCHDGEQHQITLMPPLAGPDAPGGDLPRRIGQVTQVLVRNFEARFLEHPEQWRYLHSLPQYFDDPVAETRYSQIAAQGGHHGTGSARNYPCHAESA